MQGDYQRYQATSPKEHPICLVRHVCLMTCPRQPHPSDHQAPDDERAVRPTHVSFIYSFIPCVVTHAQHCPRLLVLILPAVIRPWNVAWPCGRSSLLRQGHSSTAITTYRMDSNAFASKADDVYGPVAQLRTAPGGTVYSRTQLTLERPSRPYG